MDVPLLLLPDAVQLSGFRKINSWLQGVKILRCSYIRALCDIFGNFSHSRRGGYRVSVFASSGFVAFNDESVQGRDATQCVPRFRFKHVEGKQRRGAAPRRSLEDKNGTLRGLWHTNEGLTLSL